MTPAPSADAERRARRNEENFGEQRDPDAGQRQRRFSGAHRSAARGLCRAAGYDSAPRRGDGKETLFTALAKLPNPFGLGFSIASGPFFDIGSADLLVYRHALDIDHGIAHRVMIIRHPQGGRIRVVERRLVSTARPELVALRWIVEPLDATVPILFRSAMSIPAVNCKIPRNLAYEGGHWRHVEGAALPPDLAVVAESVDARSRIFCV